MRAVNLLPSESSTGRGNAKRFDPLVVGGVVLTAVVAIAIGGAFVVGRSHATSAQHDLDAARAALARAIASQTTHGGTSIVQTPAVTGQIPTWKTAVETALSTRVAYDAVLAQIGRLVPANVTLTSLTLGEATGAGAVGAAAGGALAIAGTAFDQNAVAQLLARLTLIPQVTGVTLTSSVADSKSCNVTFNIAAQLKGAPTAFTTSGNRTPSTMTTSGSGA